MERRTLTPTPLPSRGEGLFVCAVWAQLAVLAIGCSSTPHRDEVDPRPPPATMPPERIAHCGDGQDAFAAFCRVNGRIAWARSRRDEVLVSCLNGPHQRLRGIRDSMPDAGPDDSRLGDLMTQREVLRLEREAEACFGEP